MYLQDESGSWEIFYMSEPEMLEWLETPDSVWAGFYNEDCDASIGDAAKRLAGWWWWSCFPGCMPEGDPAGPFETKEAALADAAGE